jgi:putative ABC transport system permease protein
MGKLLQDLGYGARMLLAKPGFTIITILTLALGIGANTAIFTVLEAALLRGLPYNQPDRLFHLWETTPQKEYPQREFSYPDYQDYLANQVFEGVAAYTGGGGSVLTGRGEPERIFAPSVSANFFSLLGVAPIIGRTFSEGDDKPGASRVVVLSYGFWQRMFARDSGVVGQTLTINGTPQTVIGVMPPSFTFAMRPGDLWMAYQPSEVQLTRRFLHGTNLIARLKSGVSIEQAQSEMSSIALRIAAEHSDSHVGTGARLVPLHEQIVGTVKPILFALLLASAFVLLIGCANVANLLLARSLGRQKEIAIRAALGARNSRIVRQLLTESLLMSLIGGLAGLLFAIWGVDALISLVPEAQLTTMPFLRNARVNASALAFTFGLSLLTGIVFGLAPALAASKLDLHNTLKEGGRSGSGLERHRVRRLLVVAEIALAVVLLAGAGLMMKSLWRLMQVNIGFDPHNVLSMTVALPGSKYQEQSRIASFQDQLTARVSSLPGVAGAGLIDRLPLLSGNTTRFFLDGEAPPPPGEEIEANFRQAGKSYFQTLGIPLIRGRFFDERDVSTSPGVVIMNKSLAERLLPGQDPVGRRIRFRSVGSQPIEIVGVAGDVKVTGLDDAIKPVLYFPLTQGQSLTASLVVRTTGDPADLIGAVRNTSRALEPELGIFNVRTIDEMIADSPAAFFRRLPAWLIGIFAVVALLLASIGISGVISYSVSQQTREIGVRLALGARPKEILGMVVRKGMTLAVSGAGIGLLGAFALTRFMEGLLFGVSATDPIVFIAIAILLVLVALLACYIPALRASRVDPMIALRYE